MSITLKRSLYLGLAGLMVASLGSANLATNAQAKSRHARIGRVYRRNNGRHINKHNHNHNNYNYSGHNNRVYVGHNNVSNNNNNIRVNGQNNQVLSNMHISNKGNVNKHITGRNFPAVNSNKRVHQDIVFGTYNKGHYGIRRMKVNTGNRAKAQVLRAMAANESNEKKVRNQLQQLRNNKQAKNQAGIIMPNGQNSRIQQNNINQNNVRYQKNNTNQRNQEKGLIPVTLKHNVKRDHLTKAIGVRTGLRALLRHNPGLLRHARIRKGTQILIPEKRINRNVVNDFARFLINNETLKQYATNLEHSIDRAQHISRPQERAKNYIVYKESNGRLFVNSYGGGKCFGKYQLNKKDYLKNDKSVTHQELAANRYVRNRYGTWRRAKHFRLHHNWY